MNGPPPTLAEAATGEDRRAGRLARVALQLLGFAAGIGLLVWTVRLAFGAESADALARVREASPWALWGLLGLSLASLLFNGLAFWLAGRAVAKLGVWDVVATNSLATLLSYLPLKIGFLSRVLVHNRRDGVALFTIGAWFGGVTVLALLAPLPILVASVWRERMDLWWWLATLGGLVVLGLAAMLGARIFAGEAGLTRLHRVLDPVSLGVLRRFTRSAAFARLHGGFDIIASGRVVWPTLLVWLLDYTLRAGRFLIVASVLGMDLGAGEAMLIGSAFFLVGAISPVGMVGTREAGAMGAAWLIDPELLGIGAALIVLISGVEAVAFLIGGGLGLVWLRPDRLLRVRGAVDEGEGENAEARRQNAEVAEGRERMNAEDAESAQRTQR